MRHEKECPTKLTNPNAMIRNQVMHDRLSRYAQIAIETLAKRLEGGAIIPTLPETAWTFQGEANFLLAQTTEKPIWSIFLHQSRQSLEELPDYQTCLTLLRNDSVIGTQMDRLVGISGTKLRVEATSILDRLAGITENAKWTSLDDSSRSYVTSRKS